MTLAAEARGPHDGRTAAGLLAFHPQVTHRFAPILSASKEEACATVNEGNYSKQGCEYALWKTACLGAEKGRWRPEIGCQISLIENVAAVMAAELGSTASA